MLIRTSLVRVARKRPIRISRGTTSYLENVLVEVEEDGIVGWGECAPTGYGAGGVPAERLRESIEAVVGRLEEHKPWDIVRIERVLLEEGIPPPARAGVNMGCWDWLGKRAGLPLYRLLGLGRCVPPTSVTVGINDPAVVEEEVRSLWEELRPKVVKVKLGGGEGVLADQERYRSVLRGLPEGVAIRVDANGGWTLKEAEEMLSFLFQNRCEFVEQPLPLEAMDEMRVLFQKRPLPIILDEAIWKSEDVARWRDYCDGVNVKLMKCGGISEALRMVHTARALGLRLMIGCFAETSLSISAGSALGSLFDFVDLDSQLNLQSDPFAGVEYQDGTLHLQEEEGIGVKRI